VAPLVRVAIRACIDGIEQGKAGVQLGQQELRAESADFGVERPDMAA